MKLRRITPALTLAAMLAAGGAYAQSSAPTTPSTTPNDSTATPPNNPKVPPGTASPPVNSTATPQSNTGKGTTTHKKEMRHDRSHSTTKSNGMHKGSGTMGTDSSTSGSPQPSKSVPATGSGK